MDDGVPAESVQRPPETEEAPRDPSEVLSSINCSLSILDDQLRQSEVPSLAKVAGLLQDHGADLPTYLSSDPKGKLVARFLIQLATELTREQELLRRECQQLARNMEEIKGFFASEQDGPSVAVKHSAREPANTGETRRSPKPLPGLPEAVAP